jgi:hypothetical protein
VEGLQRPLLAHELDLVDILVTTIVTSTWVSFTVLVREDRTETVKDSPGGKILASNQDKTVSLASLFLLDQLSQFRICLEKRLVEDGPNRGSEATSRRTANSGRKNRANRQHREKLFVCIVAYEKAFADEIKVVVAL